MPPSVISPEVEFDLVHVGKCGGTTVVQELAQRGYRFEHVHMRRPCVAASRRYVVLVRDPVSRFVSAFNWRRHRLRQSDLLRVHGCDYLRQLKQDTERSLLSRFASANQLAEHLIPEAGYDTSPAISLTSLIGHVTEGFSWYLGCLIDEIEPAQLLGVICQETLEEDVRALFGFKPTASRNSEYPRSGEPISPTADANLRAMLVEEYRTLAKLSRLAERAGLRMSVRYSPQ